MIPMDEKKDTDLSLKLFVVFSRAFESIQTQVANDIKRYGLNQTEFAVLELLYHKGEQPIQKIGKKVLLASSSITYVVDKLEQKKLLKRQACPKDRRVTYAVITEEGKSLMADVFPKHKQSLREILAGLHVDEKAKMIDQLKRLGLFAENYQYKK